MEEHGIGWAVKQMQNGARVARAGWNGKGMWLFLVNGVSAGKSSEWTFTNGKWDNFACASFVAMKPVDGIVIPWLCSQADLLATDWETVD